MLRRNIQNIIWSLLLISVVLTRNCQCSPASKPTSRNATKAVTKSSTTLVTSVKPATRTTPSHSSSTRSGTQVKKATKRTTTAKPTTTESSVDQVLKMHFGSSSSSNKTNDKKRSSTTTTTTTTLSPVDVMNKLYQMHGMSSSGSSYHKQSSSYSSHESSMDDIYKMHALALAHASSGHSYKKKPQESNSNANHHHYSDSSSESTTTKPASVPYKSMEQIYQQHSSLPSAMHHIMAQHSAHPQTSRPQKTKTKQPQPDASSTGLSTLMQPLLKQLTPVGAGISVVLAPLLLFNGFLTFFSNISRFLNNFAQTILPARKPGSNPGSNPTQNANYYQNLGPAHLRRQPRDWFENLQYIKDVDDLTEKILRAIQAGEQ